MSMLIWSIHTVVFLSIKVKLYYYIIILKFNDNFFIYYNCNFLISQNQTFLFKLKKKIFANISTHSGSNRNLNKLIIWFSMASSYSTSSLPPPMTALPNQDTIFMIISCLEGSTKKAGLKPLVTLFCYIIFVMQCRH